MIFGKPFEKYPEWYKWYAWYPVRLDTLQIAWLEIVYRKDSPYTTYAHFKKYLKENNGN
jgi:hypothetical protein